MIKSNTTFGVNRLERLTIRIIPETDQYSTKYYHESFFEINSQQHCFDASENLKLNPINSLAPTFQSVSVPYFQKIYLGNGVDHMNINLVNINQSGLMAGDEIGVFDGIYCVGSSIIEIKDITNNNISIPASANDTIESQPNGYIDGHKITLKLYRLGTVYELFFQTVNNSQNIFKRGGSMFAQIDLSQSTENQLIKQLDFKKIYPNPFGNKLTIEITVPKEQQLEVSIFNQDGKLIKSVFSGHSSGQLTLYWDGKDNNQNQVPNGQYYCKINGSVTKIVYSRK